jgi:hypothetical protein
MDNITKKYLLIDKCIAIANGERAKAEIETIKDKKHLAKIICANENKSNNIFAVNNKYMVLYRAEKDGFNKENKELITVICEILEVTEKQLVKS